MRRLTHEIDRFVPVAVPLAPVGGSTALTVTFDADSRDVARLGARSLATAAGERAEQARHLVAAWMFDTRAMQRELPAWLLPVAHVD